MDNNRARYKPVGSKFRSTDDSRALRAITQKDGRREKRSNVVRIHRNIPERLSPEPSPAVPAIRSTKKALAAAAVIARTKSVIQRLGEDSTPDDSHTRSTTHAGLSSISKANSPMLKNFSGMKNSPSTAKTKTTKPPKLIAGKTLEELRSERMERLKLYKQHKQRKLERERATKKPNFWLGVAKREPKVMLLPTRPKQEVSSRKQATPSKALAPVWHAGFSSMSKQSRQVSHDPTSATSSRAGRSSRNLFSHQPGPSSGATGQRGAAAAVLGSNKVHGPEKVSFAPKQYKFTAPPGLQRLATPRRPSIRFSRTPPPVTPPSSGPRRMPRTKTPRPQSDNVEHSAHSTSSGSTSSGDELRTQPQGTLQAKPSRNKCPKRTSSTSSKKRKSGSAESPWRISNGRSSQSLKSERNLKSPAAAAAVSCSSDHDRFVAQSSSSCDSEEEHLPQRDAKLVLQQTGPSSLTRTDKKETAVFSAKGSISVTPPNTELSFAVLADSQKKSRERSISKVARSNSIKKSNLISRLSLCISSSSSLPGIHSTFESAPPIGDNSPTKSYKQRASVSCQSNKSQRVSIESTGQQHSTESTDQRRSTESTDQRRTTESTDQRRTTESTDQRRSTESTDHRRSAEPINQLTVIVPEDSGCSPELQPRGPKRTRTLKTVELPLDVEAGDHSTALGFSTPAPSCASVRRSARIASLAYTDGGDGCRTPARGGQRTTATTPCSRSTRRSLAVRAAATWLELCAASPRLPADPSATPGRRGRRRTVAAVAGDAAADEEQQRGATSPHDARPRRSHSSRSDKKKRNTKPSVTPELRRSPAEHQSLERPRKLIHATPVFSVYSASSGSSRAATSPPAPLFSARQQRSASSSTRRTIRPCARLSSSVGLLRLRSLALSSSSSEGRPSQRQSSGATSPRQPPASKKLNKVMRFSSCSSSEPSPSASASSACGDLSQLLDNSPFINTERRARRRKKLAPAEASFTCEPAERLRHSPRQEEEEEGACDLTGGEMAELLRPTTPRTPADVSVNVWDELSPPSKGSAEPDELASAEERPGDDKENQAPASAARRTSYKPARRSSLKDGAPPAASRKASMLHSRVSLGLFAKEAPTSPASPVVVADGVDLISWNSPRSAPRKSNGAAERHSHASPGPGPGTARGQRVSRLAALYEQVPSSPAPSPAAVRRSSRLHPVAL